jgi:hypothetical protein
MEEYDHNLDTYVDTILDDKSLVVGEIYIITNMQTNKAYVGQTSSHYLNHKKYRPKGYNGRFANHISESRTDENKQTYLKAAIRKYGPSNFRVDLVKRCKIEDLDSEETHYILKYNTLYPNGYNLTIGGKSTRYSRAKIIEDRFVLDYTIQRRTSQTEVTKQKIKASLKETHKRHDVKEAFSKKAMIQHMSTRLKTFDGIVPDINNIDSYIRMQKDKENIRIIVRIQNKETMFYGHRDDCDQIKQRAVNFIQILYQQHNQIAGTSLEL